MLLLGRSAIGYRLLFAVSDDGPLLYDLARALCLRDGERVALKASDALQSALDGAALRGEPELGRACKTLHTAHTLQSPSPML